MGGQARRQPDAQGRIPVLPDFSQSEPWRTGCSCYKNPGPGLLLIIIIFIYWFQRGRERNISHGENHGSAASCTPPTGDRARSPGLCPDPKGTVTSWFPGRGSPPGHWLGRSRLLKPRASQLSSSPAVGGQVARGQLTWHRPGFPSPRPRPACPLRSCGLREKRVQKEKGVGPPGARCQHSDRALMKMGVRGLSPPTGSGLGSWGLRLSWGSSLQVSDSGVGPGTTSPQTPRVRACSQVPETVSRFALSNALQLRGLEIRAAELCLPVDVDGRAGRRCAQR